MRARPSERQAVLMALYRIHFIDHGGNIYATHHSEQNNDDRPWRTLIAATCCPAWGVDLRYGTTTASSTGMTINQFQSSVRFALAVSYARGANARLGRRRYWRRLRSKIQRRQLRARP